MKECKRFISSISAILKYMAENGLNESDADKDDIDEESVEEILRKHNISPQEFTDFVKSKSKVFSLS